MSALKASLHHYKNHTNLGFYDPSPPSHPELGAEKKCFKDHLLLLVTSNTCEQLD
jgi:hypothetical protein